MYFQQHTHIFAAVHITHTHLQQLVFEHTYLQLRATVGLSISVVCNCRTHSSYKATITFKLFISISPVLHINFISRLYSGCISDKEITRKCGFIEALDPGDQVMADKGFNIQDLLSLQHV
jgi:hypothetical protein